MKRIRTNKPWIVGVGASAGGLEALEAFFKRVPHDSGMTYVVIQHLSPDFKSLMDELLARHTKLRIERVDNTVTIKPNTIYLIPPKKNLDIKGARLIPSDQDPTIQLRLPIDHFFISLAEQYGSNAIGVILSGTGCDGTRGAGAIKESDGFIAVQEPATCQFDGMPKSIIRQNLHDIARSPGDIPEIILKYVQGEANNLDFSELEKEPDKLRVVTDLLQSPEGLNFGDYRPSTIARRIERRVKLNHLKSVDEYIKLLEKDEDELRLLHNELLIGVTRFFRDKDEFDHLRKKIVPRIIKRAVDDEEDTLRVWVAGCSTGEEAYSLAICIHEYLDTKDITLGVKVFATDVDRDAIEVGTRGRYPESIVEDLGKEIVEKYFFKKDSSYEVRSKLRKSIIFSHHNATKDPPFTKMHLISCRNMLIYFQPSLQMKTLSLFHFGLTKQGVLFLGKSESLGQISGEFKTISQHHRFFEKIRDVKLALARDISISQPYHSSRNLLAKQTKEILIDGAVLPKEPLLNNVYEKLLNRYVPPCILIDENHDLLHVFGDASRFLNFPVGKITLNVMKILDKDLSLALSTALMRAEKTKEEVLFTNIKSQSVDDKVFSVRVEPFPVANVNRLATYMVTFEEVDKKDSSDKVEAETYDSSTHSIEQISNLEEQLQSTKETLQATIEELETTNEELQSTNEELMSSNEELQSSNEELQSVNEELYTVNSEHQSKIEEISENNRDIDFLLSSSKIATMFLDKDLKIRRFNKQMQSIVGVMDHDIGRPITDLTFNVANDKIVNQILLVCRTGKSQAQEVVKRNTTFLVQAVSYQSLKSEGSARNGREKHGVVLSFIDVSSVNEVRGLKRLNEDAEEFNYIVSHDLQKPIRRLNQSAAQLRRIIDSKAPITRQKVDRPTSDIEENLTVLSNMYSELLRYSRLRTRGAKFKKFKPKTAVNDVLKKLNSKLDGAEISVSELPEHLYGDTTQFKELLIHIFDNAVVHHNSRRKLRINLNVAKKGATWEFSIKDNGSGFNGLDPKKAFEIFHSTPNGKPIENLGVGLALSKRIVHRHGGDIWVESNGKIGATICFTIPEGAKPTF